MVTFALLDPDLDSESGSPYLIASGSETLRRALALDQRKKNTVQAVEWEQGRVESKID